MKLLLIILVAAIAAVSGANLKEERIIGGVEAVPNSLPFQVLLHITTSSETFVDSGSLISENYVLSAASILFRANSVKMFFGKHNVTYVEDTEVQLTSTNIIIHDKWNQDNMNNDIALIMLPTPIEFTPEISPVKLPKLSDIGRDYMHETVRVSGWGKVRSSSTKPSEVLVTMETQIFDDFYCELIHPGYFHQSLCSRGDTSAGTGVGICTGDSGSPLILVEDGVQIGVANLASWYGCDEGWPSVYTKVWSYLGWIADNTDALIEP